MFKNSSNINNMQDFIMKLKKIKSMGFVKTHRKGNTGVGKTLEDLLGIKENCIPGPDLHKIELKSARINSNSKLTLATKAPEKRGINNKLRETYGYKTIESKNLNPDLKILHTTLNGSSYNTLNEKKAFKLKVKNDKLIITHYKDGETEAFWSKDTIKQIFNKKYPINKLYYVKAKSKFIDEVEHFHYKKAYLLENFSSDQLLKHIRDGIIEVDIRIGLYKKGKKVGKTHDHGTAFRINPSKLDLCFNTRKRLI